MTLIKEHAPFLVQCSGGRFRERDERRIEEESKNSLQRAKPQPRPLSAAIHFLQTP